MEYILKYEWIYLKCISVEVVSSSLLDWLYIPTQCTMYIYMNTRSLLAFNLLAWLTSGAVRPALRQCAPVYISIQQVFVKSNISIFLQYGWVGVIWALHQRNYGNYIHERIYMLNHKFILPKISTTFIRYYVVKLSLPGKFSKF